jgi:hypothetical protein
MQNAQNKINHGPRYTDGYARFLRAHTGLACMQAGNAMTLLPSYYYPAQAGIGGHQAYQPPVELSRTIESVPTIDELFEMSADERAVHLERINDTVASLFDEFPELSEFNSLDGEDFHDIGE